MKIIPGSLVDRAIKYAHWAHRDQYRKYSGEPYIVHPVAVMKLVRGETRDEEVIAAAVLHDVLEDTDVTERDLVERFGSRVAQLVVELTDVYTKEAYPEINRAERKRRECLRLSEVSDQAKLIKWADLVDNTSDIVENDARFAETYLIEKAAILRAIRL